MLITIITKYNQILFYCLSFYRFKVQILNRTFQILPLYYRLTSLVWEDGLLIDFLQKKLLDKWIRQFLINSANIFNERLVFKFVVKFYIDLVLLPQSLYSYFEVTNVASLLTIVWLTLSFILLLINLNLLYFFM